MKWLKRGLVAFVGLLVLLYLVAAILFRVVDFSLSEKQVAKRFGEHQPLSGFYDFEGREIHYVTIGADSLPMVLLVHGSPGSWDNYIDLMTDSTFYTKVRIVAVDRLGFGKTGGKPEGSLKKQAAALVSILKYNKNKQRPILVGHSYGGPVIARLAIDHPDLVGGLVFVGASNDPELENRQWLNELASWWIVRLILPEAWVNSNTEIIALKKELKEMLPLWNKIRQPVTVIQGTKDRLVSPANADFAEKMLVNAQPLKIWRLDGVNHFIPWTNTGVIKQAIEEQMED